MVICVMSMLDAGSVYHGVDTSVHLLFGTLLNLTRKPRFALSPSGSLTFCQYAVTSQTSGALFMDIYVSVPRCCQMVRYMTWVPALTYFLLLPPCFCLFCPYTHGYNVVNYCSNM